MKTAVFVVYYALLVGFATGAEIPDNLREDLATCLEYRDTGELFAAQKRLRAVLEAKGEPGEQLALHIVETSGEEHRRRDNLDQLLGARAYRRGEDGNVVPHLDGAYLKKLAMLSVPDDADQVRYRDYRFALAYWKLHPEDHELYWRLRLAATRDAKIVQDPTFDLDEERAVPDLETVRKFVWKHYPRPIHNYGYKEAWDILIQLGVLKVGMTVEEAEKILGPRFRKKDGDLGDGWIRWYLDTPRHVNPNLNAEVKDGKILSFRISNA